MANVLKQFRRRYVYPWLKSLYPYKQPWRARAFRTKITSTAADARLAKILSPSCKVLDYRSGRVLSNGAPVRDLSDFPFWPTACARLSVSPTSILKPSAPASAPSRTTPYPIGCQSIAPTIFGTYRNRNNGIWLFPILPIL